MKRKVFVAALVTAIACICGCGSHKDPMAELNKIRNDWANKLMKEEEEREKSLLEEPGGDKYIEVYNEELVSKALGDEAEHFKMDTFHEICKELGTGALLSVEAGEDGPDVYLDIVAQDGTPYRYYYFKSGGLQGVKNLETGEWPYASVE